MARRDRPQRKLRGPPVVELRKRILVVCEGEVTEPNYLNALKDWKKTPTVEVRVEGPAGDPFTLVTKAKEMKISADAEAEKRDDDTFRYDEVWCCFDVDKFDNVARSRDMAKANGLFLAMSNPCFELWLYLHFKDSPGMQGHHDMQDLWKKLQPELAEKHIDFETMKAGYDEAIRRAKRLDEAARQAGEPNRNPTTEVYLLVLSIDAEGRERREAAERERREQESSRGREQAAKAEALAWELVKEQETAEAPAGTSPPESEG